LKVDARRVIQGRMAEQRALVGRAERFAGALDQGMGVLAVVVFGSVARGDFNLWSDVDVLVVVREAGEQLVDRVRSTGREIGLVEPVVWTSDQLQSGLERQDPIAVESVERGIWLVGSVTTASDGR
jgi:predicted nucleotidyltransferase